MKTVIYLIPLLGAAAAWIPACVTNRKAMQLDMAAVGIFYGTGTGSTQTAADLIYEAFGSEVAAEPVDVDTLEEGQVGEAFAEHDALVVGTPTWNTGADTERSGTGWDELYYKKLPALKDALKGKKVAVFGLGDQVSYSENYADATGELFDVFESLGCQMLGSWSQEGYEHDDSKSIRGDKFCGLLLDMVNQEELTEDRVQRWVSQLKEEGILDGTAGATGIATEDPLAAVEVLNGDISAHSDSYSLEDNLAQLELDNAELRSELQDSSNMLDQNIGSHSTGGFTPHHNPESGRTMWTSPDGRKSFVTTPPKTNLSP